MHDFSNPFFEIVTLSSILIVGVGGGVKKGVIGLKIGIGGGGIYGKGEGGYRGRGKGIYALKTGSSKHCCII